MADEAEAPEVAPVEEETPAEEVEMSVLDALKEVSCELHAPTRTQLEYPI
jgi:hypothetical protein